MKRVPWMTMLIAVVLVCGVAGPAAAKPEGTLTVAVATFGNERWLPHLYVGAEDIVLKPLWENLLSRDAKGNLIPMLAEKWQVTDEGKTWKFQLKKGVRFHNGAELTAEDVKFTFTSLARDGSANSMAPEFRTIKSMEIEGPHAITIRFDKPFVTYGNRVTQGLFASVAYIQSKKHIEAGEQAAERQPVGTGPGSSWSTCAATGSCSRRSRATGARRPTSSASCSSKCPSRPRAWPCCAPATPTSSRSAASTWTS